MRIPHNAVPGSEAEARAIRAIEAYYDQHRNAVDKRGNDLFRQCAQSIVDMDLGDLGDIDDDDAHVLRSRLETAFRGNGAATWLGIGDSIVDLACILGLVPSFAEWTGERDQ